MRTEEQRIKDIIAVQLGVQADQIASTSTFCDLGADSLDMVELAMEIEDEFAIEVPDEKWEVVTTVQDAIDLVAAAS